MDQTPKTNVVGVFNDPADASAAVKGLRGAGFASNKIAVAPQVDQTVISVQADGRHAEAAAQMEDNGSTGVQNVAR